MSVFTTDGRRDAPEFVIPAEAGISVVKDGVEVANLYRDPGFRRDDV